MEGFDWELEPSRQQPLVPTDQLSRLDEAYPVQTWMNPPISDGLVTRPQGKAQKLPQWRPWFQGQEQ